MPNIKICSLYSGSRGNSAYINAGGASILIDAGKSAKALCSALKEINVDICSIDAIFITHEHSDHIKGVEQLALVFSEGRLFLVAVAVVYGHYFAAQEAALAIGDIFYLAP